ncbi:thioredoxin family protein [Burkholderia cepacia]|uniref:Thioredoxin family protein n=1 Tax=Burkholderia cepacia TaxID=292 RepID=A0A8I1AIR0_BURCE|nr:thioredoxin family protein [Burkholderia cepacia]MBA9898434.1 thioredoxin family protein [Burkholderia cepacia]MBA9946055.1 thioredoxin family protein [Burkholderia cepacia]MBA9978303.1 thioredoxin family protein [Burkholderia cepacia]MBA9994395.1 thioredoxin family protein [Burkholderia cepacia]MBB0003520.1 thioredoxin family protein [Burkholderia cepacia]
MKTALRNLTAACLLAAAAGAAFAAAAPTGTPVASASPDGAHLPPGIAWQHGDVDAAFALAKRTGKPLLLYWGAVWCPSCNQVKSTIFSQQAFKTRSSFFVPVYLDGDTESAQKLGERFKVHGYPTMILFRPDGTEVTRLPGEADLDRYMQALSLGMTAAHPVRQTLATALKNGASLTPDEWRLLADYSWDTDGALPVPADRVAETLQSLAQRARAAGAKAESARFALKSAVVAAPARVVAYLGGGDAQRAKLRGAYDTALARLSTDTTLSSIDRLMALHGRVLLARGDARKGAPLAVPALADTARKQILASVQGAANAYERQALVSEGADTLTDAGLYDESDALLKAELPRSSTPYYFMSGLAANAKARGDKAAALDWYRKAYDAASGPATKLRWGATYFANAVELAPDDSARIEGIAASVLAQADKTRDAFYGANLRALTKVVTQLNRWRGSGAHDASVRSIAKQFDGICGKLPAGDPQASACERLIQPVKA